MSGIGGHIWFIGLGGGLLLLAILYFVNDLRRKKRAVAPGNENAAWEQAARETGHPEVARAPAPEGPSTKP